MNEEILKRLDTFAGKLAEMGQQLGPQVWDLTMAAMRVHALNELLYAAFGACLLALAYQTGKRAPDAFQAANDASYKDDGPLFAKAFALAVITGVAGFAGLLNVCTSLTAWTIMGLYDPRILLAKKVLGL